MAGAEGQSDADWDDLVLVGIVVRTHGIRGQVIVNPYTDFPDERFHPGARLLARLGDATRVRVEVSDARVQKGRPVIGLVGVSTIEEAERYIGAELRITEADQGPLPAGQYYHHQLVGCEVVQADGDAVGRVVAVEGEMGRSRLVGAGLQKRHEIPLVDEFCTVDVAGRRIVIRPPAGLLDL